MKIAPIMRAFSEAGTSPARLLHTGQHYDKSMKTAFFEQLHIPEPEIDLGVGSGTHTVQTAEIMTRFETVLDESLPAAVLVVGDVNSTLACALVAVRKQVPVIHVEAGLRSGDRRMPEEINRILTDQLSDLLFITERNAEANLIREGIDPAKVHFVGNVMIDTLMYNLEYAVPAEVSLRAAGLPGTGEYGLLTLHRPSNVDDPAVLKRLLQTLGQISAELPLLFPVHPRTLLRIREAGLEALLQESGIHTVPPLGYLEMLGLMREARLVFTDSGGIQEETTSLGVPCITLRENTERPITVEEGTNTIVGTDSEKILAAYADAASTKDARLSRPEYWDGKAATRIVSIVNQWLQNRYPGW